MSRVCNSPIKLKSFLLLSLILLLLYLREVVAAISLLQVSLLADVAHLALNQRVHPHQLLHGWLLERFGFADAVPAHIFIAGHRQTPSLLVFGTCFGALYVSCCDIDGVSLGSEECAVLGLSLKLFAEHFIGEISIDDVLGKWFDL